MTNMTHAQQVEAQPIQLQRTRQQSFLMEVARRFTYHRTAMLGLFILVVMGVGVVFGPDLLPYDPDKIDFSVKNQPPTWAHPMGTDDLGRDQLVRVLIGGQLTLSVASVTVAIATIVGVFVGAVAGYTGGLLDNVLMRIVDVFYSVPTLFVVIIFVTIAGATFWTIVGSIALLSWMTTARLVRASFLSLKEREFVEAARSMGASHIRIALQHILPNAISPIIVAATLGVAAAILTESALSFLGLGFQPPRATWGRMLQEAQRAVISQGFWWRGLFPGLMIFITILSVNYVGDGLRDALDPHRVEK